MIRTLLALSLVTFVHMHDRPDLNDWFEHLHNNKEGLCCSGSEGSVLSTDEVRTTDIDKCEKSYTGLTPQAEATEYCVRIEGRWIQVPDGSIVIVANRYGEALVWPVWFGSSDNNHKNVYIRCFLPGSLT